MESKCITDIARADGIDGFRTYRAVYKAGGGRVKLYGVAVRHHARLTKLIKAKYPLVTVIESAPVWANGWPSITVQFPESMAGLKAGAVTLPARPSRAKPTRQVTIIMHVDVPRTGYNNTRIMTELKAALSGSALSFNSANIC